MNKRTHRKIKHRKQKSVSRSINKRNVSNKSMKTQSGGGDIRSILLGILDEKYIPFLPSTLCVNDKKLISNYLKSVSAFRLLTLIGKKDKFINSKSISGLIEDIDFKSSEVFKRLGSLTKIPESRKLMSNFNINCFKLTRSSSSAMKELHSYILDCEDYLSVKNVDWYEVALGLKPFDDEFESDILAELKNRRIIIDTDKFHYGLKLLKSDEKVKKIFKHRILECGHKPQGFFDKLFGNISWDSYNECFKCSDNSCVVKLDDNYKTFLNQKHKIMTVDKIKILIYVELRLRELSKHFALEAVRMNNDKTGKIKSLLTKIYDQDSKIGNIGTHSLRQSVMKRKKQSGGAEGDEEGKEAMPVAAAEAGAPEAGAPEAGAQEAMPVATVEAGAPEAGAPEAGAQEAVAQEAMPDAPPGAVAPEAVAPEAVAPEAVAPEAGAPEAGAPEAVAQEAMPDAPPGAVAPEAGAPEAVAPEAVAPEAGAPEAVAPEAGAPEAVAQEAVAQEAIPDAPEGEIAPVEDDTGEKGKEKKDNTSTTDMGEGVLDEKTPTFSKMIYVSFNGTINDDKVKETIANQVGDALKEICQLKNTDRLRVYRVRVGPRTVSIEIGIEDRQEGEISDKEIKDNIVKAIVDKSLIKKLVIIELDTLKDIYFDGISKYDDLKDMPSQFKRVLLEMNGKYPEKESDRIEFEEKIINDIVEILEEPKLDVDRLHLENITNITSREGRIFVQFLLMNGLYEKTPPHEILMKFKGKYAVNNGNNDFTNKYSISNVVFGEPSVILDNEDIETMKTLSEEKEDTQPIDESTFENLESDYKRIAYFGCDITVDDLKNNIISAQTPLSSECEPGLNQLLRGY